MQQLKKLFSRAAGSKSVAVITVGAASAVPVAANAAIEVPPEMLAVFTDLATAFGTLMAAGAVLFGVIRGGVALFKLARTMFGAAGA
ncbi:hypothetical protein [Stutzerimonas stutzeri]|uniref:Uncharacterized protein n=1 Tax=Stutzerimonas stutzeri KOS6 TaxID=1218352 RepID=A0A061JQC7_STUST|nr:hypothetical protein [Stutzerimonas stutzeri]EWC40843.1 hypothetical protein B597_012655 [Stutzerimonas stutzeri KOS6]